MIRGHDHQHRIAIGVGDEQRGQREGRGGVAAHGLQDHERSGDAHLAQLAGYHEPILLVGDHDRGGRHGPGAEIAQPEGGLLQKGERTGERQQLLGLALTGGRPEPGTRSTGQDDGLDGQEGITADMIARGRTNLRRKSYDSTL